MWDETGRAKGEEKMVDRETIPAKRHTIKIINALL